MFLKINIDAKLCYFKLGKSDLHLKPSSIRKWVKRTNALRTIVWTTDSTFSNCFSFSNENEVVDTTASFFVVPLRDRSFRTRRVADRNELILLLVGTVL